MSITRVETPVVWSAAASVSVAAATAQESDVVTLDPSCIAAQVSVQADNSTTPASSDQIYVWLLQTSGDSDGAGGDEYDTPGAQHAILLGIIDTNTDDPGRLTRVLPIPQKGFKIRAEGITAGTVNAITVSARVSEQRAA